MCYVESMALDHTLYLLTFFFFLQKNRSEIFVKSFFIMIPKPCVFKLLRVK